MESFVLITVLCQVIALIAILYLVYLLFKSIGFSYSIVILTVVLHFLGGYLMFFS